MMTSFGNGEIELNSGNSSHTQSPETCGMVGCNGVPMTVFPCDCEFVICSDCFRQAAGPKCNGPCPACQQPYDLAHMRPRRMGNKVVSWEDLQDHENQGQMSNRSNYDSERNVEISGWHRENGEAQDEYDHGGRGEDDGVYDSDDDDDDDDGEGRRKKRRLLSRQMSIPIVILSIYRLVIVIRFISLALYLIWRVSNVNNDAVWLWGISVVCEIWFAFSWVLDQLPKLSPINRTTDLAVLREKFDKKGPENPQGRSDLPGIDVFITTADPEKEPSLVTANTVLSILASDYPVEKLACYVSDDGGALLTYEAMAEAASFAHLWVPFCRKHGIEPRSPEAYFNSKRDPYNNKVNIRKFKNVLKN